jgi:hypothetical protein
MTSDANCAQGYWCDGVGAGSCDLPQGNGAACNRDSQCANGCNTGLGTCK